MDFEDYLTVTYTPIKAIEVLSDVIYVKSNEDWNVFSQMTRAQGEELLALNYTIKLCVKRLLELRKTEIDRI